MATASSYALRAYNIPSLSAPNYATWSIKIEMLLICSKVWSPIDGTETALRTADVAKLMALYLKDAKAHSNILLHCEEKQLISLRPLRTSKEV